MLSLMWRKKSDSSHRWKDFEISSMKNSFKETKRGEEDHYQCCHNFLNCCHHCHKPLSIAREIYMYRGEMGFCSEECRSRHMYLDDMKKIEISTKRILASFHERRRRGCDGRVVGGVATVAAPPIFCISK